MCYQRVSPSSSATCSRAAKLPVHSLWGGIQSFLSLIEVGRNGMKDLKWS